MVQRTLTFAAVCSLTLLADTVVLRSGRTVEGTYLGGDSRNVRVAVGDRVDSIDVRDIRQITFGSPSTPSATAQSSSSSSATQSSSQTGSRRRDARREVSAGTSLAIRMIDDVDSERDSVGQTYRASMDEAVVNDGATLIPRGADVVVKLVDDKQSGKLTGKTVLTLDLESVVVDGRKIDIQTQEITQESESRTRQTATRSGGGTALGAIIGAIAGGGRGAAIGAVTGAAAGGAVQVLTKGQRVRVPSETRLTFTLQQPMAL